MSHTKEIWRVTELDRVIADRMEKVNDDYFIADCFGPDAKENARRIVACVNFCAGFTTEEMEKTKYTMAQMLSFSGKDETLKAFKERDTYRELCGEMLNSIKQFKSSCSYEEQLNKRFTLEEVITKAEKLLGENNAT